MGKSSLNYKKKFIKVLCAIFSFCLIGCTSMNSSDDNSEINNQNSIKPVIVSADSFCGTWGCSQYETESHNMPPLALSNNSIRQVVKTSINGNAIRFRFSNRCGNGNLEIKSVHIAVSKGKGKIDTTTDTIITFNNGDEGVVISAGKEVYSDVFEYDLKALTEYAITIFYGSVPSKVTGHPGSRTTSYQEKGNAVCNESFSSIYKTEHWYTIAGIDVVNNENNKAVVCLGDSITDGRGTTTDAQNRWTDILAKRFSENEGTKNLGVINQGIGGTCVTTSGMERFERDVLKQTGASYAVVLYGINDIIYINSSAESIIATYKRMIKLAHKNKIAIFGGTILPFGKCGDWNEKRESVRLSVNEWIRSTAGTDEGFDGYIEFANSVKNGDKEELPEAFENDGLHPTAKLYNVLGNCPDLALFEKEYEFNSDVTENTGFDADGILEFKYSLPESLNVGESINVHIKGNNSGDTGFRVWTTDITNGDKSDVFKTDNLAQGQFDLSFSLKVKESSSYILFKGPTYNTNIAGIMINYLSVVINGIETEIDVSNVI